MVYYGPPVGEPSISRDRSIPYATWPLASQDGRGWRQATGAVVYWSVTAWLGIPPMIWHGALRGGFQRLAWHPQERLLAVGGEDGTVAAFEFAR